MDRETIEFIISEINEDLGYDTGLEVIDFDCDDEEDQWLLQDEEAEKEYCGEYWKEND